MLRAAAASPLRPVVLVLALALVLPLAAGCRGKSLKRTGEVPKRLDADEIEFAIAEAERALEEGRLDVALEWMYVANGTEGMPTEQRNRVQALMEESADQRINELADEEVDPNQLARLVEVDLPQQVAVTAGIRAATVLVAQGEYKKAYEVIRQMDELYSTHHERAAAGELLTEIGMTLSYDTSGWWIFGRKRERGREALEYLVLNYPLAPRADEAYWRLAEMYEEDKKWHEAISRHEELVTYHFDSGFRPLSLAAIPRLRLKSIESPEFDRKAVVQARQELEDWLDNFAGHEIESEVRDDHDDALRRLSESDLKIANFYRKVNVPFGVRLHATRAANQARLAGDAKREARALRLLERLGPKEGLMERRNLPGALPEEALDLPILSPGDLE